MEQADREHRGACGVRGGQVQQAKMINGPHDVEGTAFRIRGQGPVPSRASLPAPPKTLTSHERDSGWRG